LSAPKGVGVMAVGEVRRQAAAQFGSVRARKFGRFSEAWCSPVSTRRVLGSGHRESDRNDQKGNWS